MSSTGMRPCWGGPQHHAPNTIPHTTVPPALHWRVTWRVAWRVACVTRQHQCWGELAVPPTLHSHAVLPATQPACLPCVAPDCHAGRPHKLCHHSLSLSEAAPTPSWLQAHGPRGAAMPEASRAMLRATVRAMLRATVRAMVRAMVRARAIVRARASPGARARAGEHCRRQPESRKGQG